MEIVDCIDKFLNANGFEWFEKNIYDAESDLLRTAKEEDFKDLEPKAFLVIIKDKKNWGAVLISASIDLLTFKYHGFEFDSTFNAGLDCSSDLYKFLDKEKELSNEWRKFLIQNKGLVYKAAVKETVKNEKKKVSEQSHKKIKELIHKINNETLSKKKSFEHYDSILKEIEEQV